MSVEHSIKLTYTNWKGETAERTITPDHIYWGSTEWHPESQWLLRAWDHDKKAFRDFALKDFGHPRSSSSSSTADPELLAAAKATLAYYDSLDRSHDEGEPAILDELAAAVVKAERRGTRNADIRSDSKTIDMSQVRPVGEPLRKADSPTHYVLVTSTGGGPFVKDAAFFIQQGGLSASWSKNWRPVVADSIEHARELAKQMDWTYV